MYRVNYNLIKKKLWNSVDLYIYNTKTEFKSNANIMLP